MSALLKITNVQFNVAPAKDRAHGLAGWVSLTVDGRLRLSSIAVRRTRDGRMTLSFPARVDGAGIQRFFVRPLDNRTRNEIEIQVFAQLRITGAARR